MSSILITGVLAVIIIPLLAGYFINRSEVRRIEKITQSDNSLVEIIRPEGEVFKDAIREVDDWAQSNNFNPYKLLQMRVGEEATDIATWQDRKNSRTLILRCLGKKNSHEIITRFGDDENHITLSTSDDKNTHALPTPPEFFTQNFSYGNLDMLLGEHISAESFMAKKFSLQPQPLSGNIKEEILEKLCSQCDFVKSRMMWQFKGPYWRLIRRQFRSNSPVRTLY